MLRTVLNNFIERHQTLAEIIPLGQRRIAKIDDHVLPNVASINRIIEQLASCRPLYRLHIQEQVLLNIVCRTKPSQDIHQTLERMTNELCSLFKNAHAMMPGAEKGEQPLANYLCNFATYIDRLKTMPPFTTRFTPRQKADLGQLQTLIKQKAKGYLEDSTTCPKVGTSAQLTATSQPERASATGSVTDSSHGHSSATTSLHRQRDRDELRHEDRDRDSQHLSTTSRSRPPSKQPSKPLDKDLSDWELGTKLRNYLFNLPRHNRLSQEVLDSMHDDTMMMAFIAKLSQYGFHNDELLVQQVRAAAAYLGVEPRSRHFYLRPGELAWLIENGHFKGRSINSVNRRSRPIFLQKEAANLHKVIKDKMRRRW